MVATQKTYLNLISLNLLESWSVQSLLDKKVAYNKKYELAKIGAFLIKSRDVVKIEDGQEYKRVTVKIRNGGVTLRDIEKGENIGTKKQYRAKAGQFIVSKIDARNGAFGIIPSELDGAVVTNDFPLFTVNEKAILSQFLVLITTTKEFIKFAQSCSSGTTNRQRMDIDLFLQQKIPLPSLQEQERIVTAYQTKIQEAETLEKEANDLEGEIEKYLFEQLGISFKESEGIKRGIRTISFKSLNEWGLDKIISSETDHNSKYDIVSINTKKEIAISVFRGKSPKYSDSFNSFILNQKCNRWNEIDLSFVKTVDEKWLKAIDGSFLTQEGDIIINSTGEGTIGRSSLITTDFEGLLYDSHILLLRLNKSILDPSFFVEVFNSKFGQKQVDEIKSAQATKQTELGVSNLSRIKIPSPPINIQKEITKTISDLRYRIKQSRLVSLSKRDSANIDFEQEIFGNQ